jgi:hypothetical protein
MAPTGRTSAQGHDVAAAARAFWPRRSSSNRRWMAHEIGQQPVKPFRPKTANVLEMLDFIGFYNFSRSGSNWQTDLKLSGKVYCIVLHLGEGPRA